MAVSCLTVYENAALGLTEEVFGFSSLSDMRGYSFFHSLRNPRQMGWKVERIVPYSKTVKFLPNLRH